MKIWMSAEMMADIANAYRVVRKAIEADVNKILSTMSFPDKFEKWAYVAIIRDENSDDYSEVIQKISGGKTVEFRLKIPYEKFVYGNEKSQMELVFESLLRSVDLMAELGVSTETRSELHDVLIRSKNSLIR